jgi:ribokinase
MISGARVVLAQLEVPIEAVIAAAELTQGVFCLNPAPSRELPEAILERVDVLIPNRSELAGLAGAEELTSIDEMVDAVATLGVKGRVLVTLGAEGALIVDGQAVKAVAAPAVEAVDPTGAGDAFCGAIAYGLASGLDLEAAARRAVVAGAIAATRHGAQPSMPTVSELDAFLDA